MVLPKPLKTVQSNHFNTDTLGTIERKGVVLLKPTINLLFDQNTNEIKQDGSIVKLTISKLHQAVFPGIISMNTLKRLDKVAHYTLRYQTPFSA